MGSYYRGTKYSIADMQSFLRAAGWPEDLIVLMAAVGQAESSGWSGAVNDNRPHEYSVGLWQINLLVHSYNEAQMSDPIANAQAALAVYHNEGLRAWGPYVTGVYKKYLSASQAAYGGPAAPPAQVDSSSSGDSDVAYSSFFGPPATAGGSDFATSDIGIGAVAAIVASVLFIDWLMN
jgi:lysozyme-like protein